MYIYTFGTHAFCSIEDMILAMKERHLIVEELERCRRLPCGRSGIAMWWNLFLKLDKIDIDKKFSLMEESVVLAHYKPVKGILRIYKMEFPEGRKVEELLYEKEFPPEEIVDILDKESKPISLLKGVPNIPDLRRDRPIRRYEGETIEIPFDKLELVCGDDKKNPCK